MNRRDNWPRLLVDFIAKKRGEPFDWSRNNCAFFAADWVALATGVDPAADLRGIVTNALAAGRALHDLGGLEHIVREACARWDWPEITPHLAQRGDLALGSTPNGPALGVVLGATVAFPGAAGVVLNEITTCTTAWHIG